MNAVFVVVVHVIADQPAEMLFVQRDDMVKDLASATSHPALRNAILPGRLDARPLGFQTRRRQKSDDLIVELRVSIQDDVTVWASFWKAVPRCGSIRKRNFCLVRAGAFWNKQQASEVNRLGSGASVMPGGKHGSRFVRHTVVTA